MKSVAEVELASTAAGSSAGVHTAVTVRAPLPPVSLARTVSGLVTGSKSVGTLPAPASFTSKLSVPPVGGAGWSPWIWIRSTAVDAQPFSSLIV